MIKPVVIWFTGLPSSGKTTLSNLLGDSLRAEGNPVVCIDGDAFRKSLASDLGYSIADRQENIRRAAQMARLVVESGVTAICSFISPTEQIRQLARQIISSPRFVEVYVSTPLEVCKQRDVKGLYKKVAQGLIKDFTGIDSPYEVPANPDCTIDTSLMSPSECANLLFTCITQKFY